MMKSIEERYESLKEYGNIILDHDDILLFYPDYFKTKTELENIRFISKEEADKYFEENYKTSDLYNELLELEMTEEEIYNYMNQNKEFKYNCLSTLFSKMIRSIIELCELIDYIGHYPTTYPVPKEEEKNPSMEALLEKYDIMIRYYLSVEHGKMQVTSDDVVRIIETLKKNLSYFDTLLKLTYNNDWLLIRKVSTEELENSLRQVIEELESFPLSHYQKNGESKREEGKKYLRLQYGNDII